MLTSDAPAPCDAVRLPQPQGGQDLPWEQRAPRLGRARAFVSTLARTAFKPRHTFAALPAHRGASWAPFRYVLVCAALQAAVPFLERLTRLTDMMLLWRIADRAARVAHPWTLLTAELVGGWLACVLVLAFVRLFVVVPVEHLLLWALRAAREGVEGTLRAASYSVGPGLVTFLLGAWWLGELWQAVLRFWGYRAVHANRGLRTAAVALVVTGCLSAHLVLALAVYDLSGAALDGVLHVFERSQVRLEMAGGVE